MTIRRAFSGSTLVLPMRRSIGWRALSPPALACDHDGQFARAGRVNEPLLVELMANDAFLARARPNRPEFEMYGDAFVARAAATWRL